MDYFSYLVKDAEECSQRQKSSGPIRFYLNILRSPVCLTIRLQPYQQHKELAV